MSKLFHTNTLNWSDISLQSPAQPIRAQSNRPYYTVPSNEFHDLNNSQHNVNTVSRRTSNIAYSQPQPLSTLNTTLVNSILKHRPNSGSNNLRTTAPLWNSTNTNNDILHPPSETRRQPTCTPTFHNHKQHNDIQGTKLNFNRVTTLNPNNNIPHKQGISSVPLTQRSQSHYVTNNITPNKQKLLHTLDTSHRSRHQQLPSLDGELLSAPAVVQSHRTQSNNTDTHNNTRRNSINQRHSASIKRTQQHTNVDKPWPFDSNLTIQPSPQSAYSTDTIQSPTKRSLVTTQSSTVHNPIVPVLTLPTQPNGTTAQHAANELLAQPTQRQTSARPPNNTNNNRLSARIQQRRVVRTNAQSATHKPNNNTHLRTGSTVIQQPYNDTYIFDCGVAEDGNARFRASMEDAHIHIQGYGIEHITEQCQSQWAHCVGYAAIYDGHGGRECVDFIQQHLHQQLAKELRSIGYSDIYAAFNNAYTKTDEAMKNDINMQECGSTAVSVLVLPSQTRPGHRDLYCANVGDARAVLCCVDHSDITAIRLSKDHTPKTPTEIQRIIRSGGCVFNNRVAGQLAVSRAFGDIALKRSGVIVQPYLNRVELNESHKYCIIACDGLWDVCSDLEAVQLVSQIDNPNEMAQKLVQTALDRGTTDNVSVMCVRMYK